MFLQLRVHFLFAIVYFFKYIATHHDIGKERFSLGLGFGLELRRGVISKNFCSLVWVRPVLFAAAEGHTFLRQGKKYSELLPFKSTLVCKQTRAVFEKLRSDLHVQAKLPVKINPMRSIFGFTYEWMKKGR